MKKRIKELSVMVLSATMLILSLTKINGVFLPKYTVANNYWPTTSTYNQFYKMKEQSIDVLFLGSSVCVNGFSPQEIYNQYGIRSYNLGSEQQSIAMSYYWLKEALRFQSPKVVVLETKFCYTYDEIYTCFNMPEGLIRKCMDPMRWSEVKREAVEAICSQDKSQTKISYVFPNIRFHDRWKNLTEDDFNQSLYRNSQMKGQGFTPFDDIGPEVYEAFIPSDPKARNEMDPTMQEYMDKIVELCNRNKINLLLVNLPGNYNDDGTYNTLKEYASQKNLLLLDLCEKENYDQLGAVLPKERTMHHANFWGAVKLSDYIGRILKETYNIPGSVDEQYEQTKQYYEHIKTNAELSHIADFEEYLDAISGDSRYSVFLAAQGKGMSLLSDRMRDKMKNLGIQTDMQGVNEDSFYAIVSPEKKREVVSEFQATETGMLGDNVLYTILSAGVYVGNTSSIQINGDEYSKCLEGINIVVYDRETLQVVDTVNFSPSQEWSAQR